MYTLVVQCWNTENGSAPEGKDPWSYIPRPPQRSFRKAVELAYWMKQHHRGEDSDGDRPYFRVISQDELEQMGAKDEWFAARG